ncbi:MAG: hypothetical protein NVS3B5_21310 [Sphingomicrobium sp.]
MSGIPSPARVAQSPLAVYQAHLAKGQLAYQWSPMAGRAVFYPRLVCPFSGSVELEWRIASGGGTVYAASVVYPRGDEPYSVVLVDMDDGFRLMSRAISCLPESVRIGQRLTLTVQALEPDGEMLPLFLLEDAA